VVKITSKFRTGRGAPLDDNDTYNLAAAIIKQAVWDWRYLCKGGKPAKDLNFDELVQFFTCDCEMYCRKEKTTERIFRLMKLERRRAGMGG